MVEITRGVKIYFVLATAAVVAATYIEHNKQIDFYNVTMALQTKPLNVLILCNFALVLTDIICLAFIKFFFGELRGVEVSYLYDQFIKKLISIIIIFYFLSVDITNKMAMAMIIYPTLLFMLHKLAQKRMEFMTTKEEKSLWLYFKMGMLYIFLLCLDIISFKLLYHPKMYDRASEGDLDVLGILNALTLLEICKMMIHVLFNIFKFSVQLM